jgi:hypothetical protein
MENNLDCIGEDFLTDADKKLFKVFNLIVSF